MKEDVIEKALMPVAVGKEDRRMRNIVIYAGTSPKGRPCKTKKGSSYLDLK